MAVLQDLIVWQLADQLRSQVATLTQLPAARRDFSICRQIQASAGSVVANIAEGYGRRNHGDFARFVDYASGSLRETEQWLRDGLGRQLWCGDDIEPAYALCRRLTPALGNLRRYLRSTKTPET